MSLLFQKSDIRTLAVFRMLVGGWFFVDYVSMIIIGRVSEAYIDAQVNFPFYGLEMIKPLPAVGMYVLFAMLALAGLGVLLGYRYYLSLGIFFTAHLYVFLIDIVYSLNKFYLFLVLAFVLFFVQAHRYWSLDVRHGRVTRIDWVPRWNILVFQAFYGLIYTYSGISKINPDWLLRAEPLRTFFGNNWLLGELEGGFFEIVIYTFTYGGMIFDLSITWLLLNRRTNTFGNIWQATFHLLNFFLLGIGSLSLFMAVSTWLLFPTPWLKRKLGLREFEGQVNVSRAFRKRVITMLAVFMLIHILLPHRHYLTGNNVNWTEKGHRFSWRLMTRTKSGSRSIFTITDLRTGEVWTVHPSEYLTSRQQRKMSAETDLVIYFAHWLGEEWGRKGHDSVSVQAHVLTRLNGRKAQPLVDPEVNLLTVSRSYITDEVSTRPPDGLFTP